MKHHTTSTQQSQAKPWIKFEKRSPRGAQTIVNANEYQVPKTVTFRLRQAGVRYLAHVKGSSRKKQELECKREEAKANRRELEETSAKIRDTAFAVENTSQRCSIRKCHERNPSVRTCRMAKCESVFYCEELSRVLIIKTPNTKCPHALLIDFASLPMFEWRQNVPKWAGKLWSLIVQNFEFWLAGRTCFCHACGQVVASDGINHESIAKNFYASREFYG